MKFAAKTLVILLITVSLVTDAFTTVPARASEKEQAYKAYYDLIEELHKGDEWSDGYDRFALINVNNDNIPELLAVDTPADGFDNNGTNQYVLYTYFDGNPVKLGDYASGVASAGGYRGDTRYIKKTGKILVSYISAGSGDASDIVYKLQDGAMTEIAHGDYNIASDDTEWNGKPMSISKYSKKLNKAFKSKKSKSFEELKTCSYKTMRKKLG